MSILANIFNKIFHPGAATAAPTAGATASSAAPAPNQPATAAMASSAPAAATPMSAVDVEQVLNGMAQKAAEKLNWRTSIVDLMKLLGLDSSITARKELAQELHYTGDVGDSASMNIWLHRQVMNKLAANGGKVPADLKD